jgi:PEP-CTERM motif
MKTSFQLHSTLLACAAMISLGSSAQAASLFVFDAVNNVHTTPFGTESYGWSTGLGTPFVVDTTPSTALGFNIWAPAAYSTNPALYTPAVFYNPTGSISATSNIPPGSMVLHPGQAGQYAILRVTDSPISSPQTISLTGQFWSAYSNPPSTTDVHILKNGIPIFNGNVNGFGSAFDVPFSLLVNVAPGDNLDFAVGYGGNGYISDTTGITANWTVVPEPSGILLLGLTGAVALRRRRQQPTA